MTENTLKRRPATSADAAEVAALEREAQTHVTRKPSRVSEGDVLGWWLHVRLADDSWLFQRDGKLVAAGWLERRGETGLHIPVVSVDAPDSDELRELVFDAAEECARTLGMRRSQTWAHGGDTAADAAIRARGYQPVRRFYEMELKLDAPVIQTDVPAGLSLDVFSEADAHAFYTAANEAFEDDWQHHAPPFAEWWARRRESESYDPSLWFVIRDGDQLAATIRNLMRSPGAGYVAALGVRRPWRGRGLARALLTHTFAEFERRGVTDVTLDVDADNQTGATRLYRSVGMQVDAEGVIYERAL